MKEPNLDSVVLAPSNPAYWIVALIVIGSISSLFIWSEHRLAQSIGSLIVVLGTFLNWGAALRAEYEYMRSKGIVSTELRLCGKPRSSGLWLVVWWIGRFVQVAGIASMIYFAIPKTIMGQLW